MPHIAADDGKTRKILIYSINYAPEMIGVGRFTGEIGAYLDENGFDVCVVTTPRTIPAGAPSRPIPRCAIRAKPALASKFCAAQCCSERKYTEFGACSPPSALP